MQVQALSDVDLLGVMVGPRRAVQLLKETRGSIAALLSDSLGSYYVEKPANQRLLAARELIKRSLAEGFRNGEAMTSPQSVRDYLRISLTDACNLRCVYCMPLVGAAVQPTGE